MGLDRLPPVDQIISKIPDTGSGINNDKFLVVEANLQTGSVTAVTNGVLPRCRN
jgi:hypothetical protein